MTFWHLAWLGVSGDQRSFSSKLPRHFESQYQLIVTRSFTVLPYFLSQEPRVRKTLTPKFKFLNSSILIVTWDGILTISVHFHKSIWKIFQSVCTNLKITVYDVSIKFISCAQRSHINIITFMALYIVSSCFKLISTPTHFLIIFHSSLSENKCRNK